MGWGMAVSATSRRYVCGQSVTGQGSSVTAKGADDNAILAIYFLPLDPR